MNGKIFLRFLAVLLALAAVAGVAFVAFNAGVTQGLTSQVAAGRGLAGYPGYPFFGYGFLGLILGILLLVTALRAISFAFWGPHWGNARRILRGWRHGWDDENGVPPMFREWHDRAHNTPEPGVKP